MTLRRTFFYTIVSSALHESMLESISSGKIPDYAVVIESGYGKPSEELRSYIKRVYGFNHVTSDELEGKNDDSIGPSKPF